MKKYIILSILALSLALAANAQDARQRTVDTVVADVLAAMPASDASVQAVQMADLAAAAPSSVVKIASMMKTAAAGVHNSAYEYALTGLSGYASANPSVRPSVRQGFVEAIQATQDKTNKNFLLMQLKPLATLAEVPFLKDQAQDPDLATAALGTLVDIQGAENALLDLARNPGIDRSLLADALARKGLSCAEPLLLAWTSTSEGYELEAVCSALAKVGTSASLETLRTRSTPEYAALALRLADGSGDKAVAKAARNLLASEVPAYKSAGALAQMKNNPAGALKTLASALKSDDVQFRNAVLDGATEIVGKEAVAGLLKEGFAKYPSDVKIDAINWFGSNAIHDASALVASAVSDPACAATAIIAASRLGGEDCLAALAGQLNGPNATLAATALKAFNGDIQEAVAGALKNCPADDAKALEPIVKLIGGRRLSGLAPMIYALTESSDGAVAALGRSALPGVVTAADIEKVAGLLDKASDDESVEQYSKALRSAVSTLTTAEQGAAVSALMKQASNPSNFYKVLSSTCSDEAVQTLAEAFRQNQDERIVDALTNLYNYSAAPVLMEIATSCPQFKDKAVNAFTILVAAFESNPDVKVAEYARALDIAEDPAVRKEILVKVGALPTMKSFNLAGKYLDCEDLKYAAADAVRKIASVTREELDYGTLKTYFAKAAEAYAARGLADDEYALKELENVLGQAEPSPVSQLTPEEEKLGFEMLFDGTDLDKFQGDKEGYVPMNGSIYVTANYGSTGNLYTLKEYRNFVFRFEFCFLRPGVNNGVGIRTPMGVDAAYEGMCECQILDHDADIYAGWLREYQVHGSVYGVIPAKRIVHKPLGEWSTEEIRVEGDHIKVTVNGEVIVDGNIRKACKGHNVAPDGGNDNPYTVDHRNHPGMFNKKGYVSFCGHGEGLKIRNVRILDLDK
ncbi:MAG: family 16 glycoside hydrolase [Candidatus Cryptobacteroides sp.]